MFHELNRGIYRVLGFGSLLTTIIVVTSNLNEPVNAPKMSVLVVTAFLLLALIIAPIRLALTAEAKPRILGQSLLVLVSMSLLLLISNLTSAQPFEHGFFGNYGRNTGTITYFSLSVIFVAAICIALANLDGDFSKFFLAAGVANLVYFGLTLMDVEIFDWNNPNRLILGTFGNTNFVGAFMGMFFVFLVSQVFRKSNSLMASIFYSSLLLPTAFEIYKSKATQGVIVAALGVAIVLFFYIRSNFGKIVNSIYLAIFFILSGVSLAGVFQVGPLSGLLYKTSVSLRGAYWEAGWRIGWDNPLFGVGPDSYGFYYRLFRDPSVLKLTGPETVTDVAHNVFLDFFASGGFPLFLMYLLLQGLVLFSVIKGIRRTKSFDPVFAGMVAVWIGYQAQSIVSINQIGVAIWGWIFGGLLVGREIRMSKVELEPGLKHKAKVLKPVKLRETSMSFTVFASAMVLASMGLWLGVQPLASDSAYNQALKKRDLVAIDNAARKWPTNQIRIAEASKLFSDNGFMDQSIDLVRFGIDKYPESFVLWYVYFRNPQTEPAERIKAKKVLSELDPLNSEFR